MGEYDKILRIYDKLIVNDSENYEVWNFRENLLTKSFDRAVEVFLDDFEMVADEINRMVNTYIDLSKLYEFLNALIQQFLWKRLG